MCYAPARVCMRLFTEMHWMMYLLAFRFLWYMIFLYTASYLGLCLTSCRKQGEVISVVNACFAWVAWKLTNSLTDGRAFSWLWPSYDLEISSASAFQGASQHTEGRRWTGGRCVKVIYKGTSVWAFLLSIFFAVSHSLFPRISLHCFHMTLKNSYVAGCMSDLSILS